MANTTYDAIIIGSGQGGGPIATDLAQAGHKTALIEREHVGGTCVNVGCTPTKTMIASARAAYVVKRAADFGVYTGPVNVDMRRVRQRKRDIVTSYRQSSEQRTEQIQNLDLLRGEASFSGPKTLTVRFTNGETRQLTANTIIIDTGDSPAIPPIDGLDTVPYLDSTSIMELDSVPEHLVVVGAGYVALEFAQMFRRFGSQVTILQRGPQILSKEDEDIASEMAKILQEDGITIRTGTSPTHVQKAAENTIHITVKSEKGEETLTASHLLLATGRRPNTRHLNLEAAGIKTDQKGYVQVNERLETNVTGVYAIGDVKGGPAFTHISYDDYRILRANLLHHGSATTRGRLVPYTIFTDPQLGRVGLSEKEAKAQNITYRVARLPMSSVSRALEVDEPRGVMKALIDPESKQILGCAILGIDGGEIMSMIEIAMMGKLPYTALKDGVFTHPTLAESLNSLFTSIE
ncbi:pyruvate/2-oxoglutarate dehydrogenase complex dihydrolipoamide dehydrogenase (E3) component [Thermosporothrix hazakensis]|jgi:pyruvate/2-oxoglutarate dehydrogenase complex dihydrolipoamide dehydrogenase (E3) component|uniref:Pyruvate/2-oxoglutarate dehydrogenase complex dihydrolipoamide dehydrogenase (E3) component n=1 Tax=Thermosporothrix hazakensis TaxID=644383 RepID=A0A326U7Q5_THEHA|nr:mercuric reductase [Thermosporothrix hazakensis]PZW29488.1 pyruvate/2-oxoglutarate dehydrogenase complex dihydrolipoamide dehydrogenase (E3) component [Thermosporothrix hazakensis]GCE45797.1 mercuric reductase [Thermosporothrix hazakensis]